MAMSLQRVFIARSFFPPSIANFLRFLFSNIHSAIVLYYIMTAAMDMLLAMASLSVREVHITHRTSISFIMIAPRVITAPHIPSNSTLIGFVFRWKDKFPE